MRTAYESESLTEDGTLSPIFNTIEKELLKADFVVRDRAVFNRISESGSQTSYSKLSEQTDTDLILELVDFDTEVPFTTNAYFSDEKKETFRGNNSITYYGANAEFRVVLLKDNEFAGSYSFTYAPCELGCPIKINTTTYEAYAIVEREEEEPNDDPFQYISKSELELFMKNATQKLIQEIK
ncbi:MAG TPA: hypothetical protein VFM80_07620 [Gracilimonas sp.]|uniref:hypothetical protein n=1 Tax=Gracilimonas sp. TaxID=1974203 RepID=UPI002D8B1306|nr:hypothetical protein [Gracilimonas sp.]